MLNVIKAELFMVQVHGIILNLSLFPAGLLKLQHLFSLVDHNRTLELRAVKRFRNATEANQFLREIEFNSTMDRKYVILECDSSTAKTIIINHVRDIYMGNRNFHFLLTSLVMDDYLNEQVSEFGAVNITGFRILKPNTQEFRKFFTAWKKQEVFKGKNAIVSVIIKT